MRNIYVWLKLLAEVIVIRNQYVFQLELSAFDISIERWDQIVSVITLHNSGIIVAKSHNSL